MLQVQKIKKRKLAKEMATLLRHGRKVAKNLVKKQEKRTEEDWKHTGKEWLD